METIVGGEDDLKIRMLVNGHTQQTYNLEWGKNLLRAERRRGNLVVDDETRQLAKIEGLTEESSVTVYPAIAGG